MSAQMLESVPNAESQIRFVSAQRPVTDDALSQDVGWHERIRAVMLSSWPLLLQLPLYNPPQSLPTFNSLEYAFSTS